MISRSTLRANTAAAALLMLAGSVYAGTITIQPIQIRDDSGSNPANSAREVFEAAGDKIWAQAGIDLNFLSWTVYDESDFLNLSVLTGMEFSTLIANPGTYGGSSDSLVLNMWFVDVLDNDSGFYGVTEFLGGRNIAIAWDAVAAFNSGLGRLDTIAHEIGHSLGLDHRADNASDYLMTSGAYRSAPGTLGDITPDGLALDLLSSTEIATAQRSQFNVVVVPLPPAAWMGIVGLGLLGFRSRRHRIRAGTAA